MLDSITSGLVGVSSRDFFQSTPREAVVIKWVQFLQCLPPKICYCKKSSKILRDFWQLSTLILNISGTDQHIKNRKSSSKSTTTPTLNEKKFVYFGPQRTELIPLICLHPSGFFSGDYILALRGCCALKFLHVLEIHQAYLAHTQVERGSPKNILIVKIKNLA